MTTCGYSRFIPSLASPKNNFNPMIYIIISNVGMALMMIIVYLRYSRLRISSGKEIHDLHEKMVKEADDRRTMENKLLLEAKDNSDKIEKLLHEINELRKGKEGEIRLRFEAEKQIEMALQKNTEIQKRMQDWSIVQDAVMKDSKDAIVKMGNDLYRKMNETYKNEIETNKNLLGRVSKNITEFFDKITALREAAPVARVEKKTATISAKKATESVVVENPAKQLVSDLVQTMKAAGYLVNKDYFLPANFDEQKAKLMFCEVAFIKSGKLYIVDFKAGLYLEEYKKTKNKTAAESNLKLKLDKYLAYLGNVKYRESILKVMSLTKAKYDKNSIVIVVPSKQELQILKEIGYYEKARKVASEVIDFDGVNNLVL